MTILILEKYIAGDIGLRTILMNYFSEFVLPIRIDLENCDLQGLEKNSGSDN